MNRIYLTGIVYDQPIALGKEDGTNHIMFKLIVKHRAKTGIKSEIYRVNAWNDCAGYCLTHLQKGMHIALEGYLTQRPVLLGQKLFQAVEVTAREIMMTQVPPKPLPEKDDSSLETISESAG